MTLPRPPGARVTTVPRARGDKPQELTLAINPRDPSNAIVSYQQADGPGSDHHPGIPVHVHVAWTGDGGGTWAVAPETTHPGYRVSIDSSVAFDPSGHAFLVYIGLDTMSFRNPTTRHGEYVLRSADGGRSWTAPVALTERPAAIQGAFEHFPRLAAGEDSVYVVWDRILGGGGSELVLVHTHDRGAIWSQPLVIAASDGRFSDHAAAISPTGTLSIVYTAPTPGVYELLLLQSQDGGATFGAPQPVVRTATSPWPVGGFPRTAPIPGLAVDPEGSLVVVFGDNRHGDRDVFCTTSSDGGLTWSHPARVNDDPVGNGCDQAMEALAIDPSDGSINVLFYDRRDDPHNRLATVTLARSSDKGRTFVNYAWDQTQSDPTAGCLGEYLGLGARDGRVYAAWVENAPSEDPAPNDALLEPGPGEMAPDAAFPFGPTLIRVGTADFRGVRMTT